MVAGNDINIGWDGYYLGRKMGEWSDNPGSKATKRKVYVGKGMKYYETAGIGCRIYKIIHPF